MDFVINSLTSSHASTCTTALVTAPHPLCSNMFGKGVGATSSFSSIRRPCGIFQRCSASAQRAHGWRPEIEFLPGERHQRQTEG